MVWFGLVFLLYLEKTKESTELGSIFVDKTNGSRTEPNGICMPLKIHSSLGFFLYYNYYGAYIFVV